jgi:PAS domain S-box-containing protein
VSIDISAGSASAPLAVHGDSDYAIVTLDPDGNVTSWNAGARQLKGYEPDEIIGSPFSRFFTPEAVRRGWPQHELEVAREQGRFEDEGWRVRKDGSHFWASVVTTPLRTAAGHLVGYSKITRDLTERRRREEVLTQLVRPAARRPVPEIRGPRPATARPVRVLCVDDNQHLVNTLARLLKAMGHEAQVAYDGAAALRAAQTLRPEMVLLDIDMPGMNGYEVARRLLEQQREAPPRLIALTGWGRESDKQRAKEAGFYRYVVKPVTRKTLESLLEGYPPDGTNGARCPSST